MVYNPLRILVCAPCQIAVKPSRLRLHCGSSRHNNITVDESFVDMLIKKYNLNILDSFSSEDAPKTPIPGIPLIEGFMCGINGCTKTSTSLQTIKRHMTKSHKVSHKPPLKSFVQVIFESRDQRYPVTIPPSMQSQLQPQPVPSSSNSSQSPFQILLKQYSSRAPPLLEAPNNPAVLNPFLEKYRWLDILKGLSPVKIRDWVSVPRNPIIEQLEVSVEKYYKKICEEMRYLDVHTTTLRWINSTKKCVFMA